MKSLLTKVAIVGLLIQFAISFAGAQANTEIEYDSDVGTNSPHLLLLEIENSAADGWARMWFKNTADPGSRWAFLARPATGRTDAAGILVQPLIMAFNGEQKFGVDNDGVVRINKSYILPNGDGAEGQVLSTHGTGESDWSYLSLIQDVDEDTKIKLNENIADNISIKVDNNQVAEITKNRFQVEEKLTARKDASFADPNIQVHNPTDDFSWITFSNGGFANNRFAIGADPSSTGGDPATMEFYWGNITNPGGATKFISLDASTDEVELSQNTTVQGNVHINGFMLLNPRSLAPICAVGGANNGTVYFNSVAKRLRVCVDGSWINLH